jgi:hypothetical protein
MLGIVLAGLVVSTASPAAARAADPLAPAQWGLGPRAAGVPGAWLRTRGAGVVVAVLDSGVQLDHPDLAQNLWANPDEIPMNGIDDDSDGYVDDVHGANISGFGGDPSDDNGHGTHIAGIVAAVAGNDVGGSGVAPEARIMAVKIRHGHGDTARRRLLVSGQQRTARGRSRRPGEGHPLDGPGLGLGPPLGHLDGSAVRRSRPGTPRRRASGAVGGATPRGAAGRCPARPWPAGRRRVRTVGPDGRPAAGGRNGAVIRAATPSRRA